jgi:hypothetical protein
MREFERALSFMKRSPLFGQARTPQTKLVSAYFVMGHGQNPHFANHTHKN